MLCALRADTAVLAWIHHLFCPPEQVEHYVDGRMTIKQFQDFSLKFVGAVGVNKLFGAYGDIPKVYYASDSPLTPLGISESFKDSY